MKRIANNMFPLKDANIKYANVVVGDSFVTTLWYQRLGHMNFQALKLMKTKSMIIGMFDIAEVDLYDDYFYWEQAHLHSPTKPRSFSKLINACTAFI